ncbi:DUF2061 domain-containing protein [Bermanella sp. R86510]|uniref:DUF2061 domain-containing protein n=1 Tax=unclassified Bermanella TaxID=2627862 RepID=UPI0037C9EF17
MKKTLSFAIVHFSVAFTVTYLLTGDILIGSLIALVEPMVNTIAFHFHEKVWVRISKSKAADNVRLAKASFKPKHSHVH